MQTYYQNLAFRNVSVLCINLLPLPARQHFSSGYLTFVWSKTSLINESEAQFQHRTSHVLNLLQMSKNNYSFCSVALGSAHVKFDFKTSRETCTLKVKKKKPLGLWILDQWLGKLGFCGGGVGGSGGLEEKPEKPPQSKWRNYQQGGFPLLDT